MSITDYGFKNLKVKFLKKLKKFVRFADGRMVLSKEGEILQKVLTMTEEELHDSFCKIKSVQKKRILLALCLSQ